MDEDAVPLEPSQRALLRVLLRTGPDSRRALAGHAHMDPATVARALAGLRERGFVSEGPRPEPTPRSRGRPPTSVSLSSGTHVVLGIRLGLSEANLGLVDLGGNVLGSESVWLRPEPERQFESVLSTARRLAGEAAASGTRLLGCGVGAAGVVDPLTGTVRMELDDPHAARIDVAHALERAIGTRVHVDTLGRAMAIGEAFFGTGRGVPSLALLYVGRVVRLGIVRDGQADWGDGEYVGMGHAVLDPEGPTCYCGQHGCFEVYTSVARVEMEARRLASEAPRSVLAAMLAEHPNDPLAAVAAAVRGRDPLAMRLLGSWARWLARGLVIVHHAFHPARLVIAGPDPLVHPDALALVAEEVARISPRLARVPIEQSSLPFPDIAIAGSAGLALDRILEEPTRPRRRQRWATPGNGLSAIQGVEPVS